MRVSRSAWELPEWLRLNYLVLGHEDDPDEGDEGEEDEGEEDDEDDDEGEEPDEKDGDKKRKDGFKSDASKASVLADLARERRERQRLQREAAARKKKDDEAELKTKTEVEQATTKLTKAEERAANLAKGFLTTRLDNAIERVARELRFKDVDDALSLVDRSEIEVEQDEDDPSKVKIDSESLKAAVKALATKKKHLISEGTDDGEPTGGQFGNKKKKGKAADDEVLVKKYRI